MKVGIRAGGLLSILLLALGCSSDDDANAGTLTITLSGEAAASTGYSFPPSGNDPAFVDGWDLKFDRVLVTVDNIILSNDPDLNPTDQSQTGAVVARKTGPFAVDLSRPGVVGGNQSPSQARQSAATASLLESEGKDPHAQLLVRFDHQDNGDDFDPTVRYAFGYDVVTATGASSHLNFDAADETDYADMVAQGYSILYVGTATFKGGTSCQSSDASYDFTQLPNSVKFRFGFKTPTTYKNCQNTDFQGGAIAGEEAQRGVQVQSDGATVAQMTIHTDHPFWNTVDHDAAELYFDQMAAAADKDGNLTLDDLSVLDFTDFKDRTGKSLPWRSCIADKPVKSGPRFFDAGSVAVNPQASPAQALRNYADYVMYQQSTQGHLNADGLCAVSRNFPAPR